MDTFNFDFDTDSTLTNDTNSNHSQLDWTAFQSTNGASQQDDAVAPDHRSNTMTTPYDDGIYFEIERFFSGLNQEHQQQIQSNITEPIHVNNQISEQINYLETPPPPVSRNKDFIRMVISFSIAGRSMNDHRLVYLHHLYHDFHHHVHNVIINCPIMLLN